MTKFKKGDMVRCISFQDAKYAGFGYTPNLIFEAINITETASGQIVFGGRHGAGVYSEYLIKVGEREIQFLFDV